MQEWIPRCEVQAVFIMVMQIPGIQWWECRRHVTGFGLVLGRGGGVDQQARQYSCRDSNPAETAIYGRPEID